MIRESIIGAAAGLAATAPMTAAMKVGHRRLAWYEQYPLPPRQITMKVASELGLKKHLDRDQKKGMTLLAHYGYGTAMGALFGAMMGAADGGRSETSPATGMAFGIGVWAGSYLGLLPALGILRPATQHPARRNLLMIGAHLVWGASLAGLFRAMQSEFSDVR